MDFLKKELERKRKAIELAKKSTDVGRIETGSKRGKLGGKSRLSAGGTNRIYLKAADLRRFRENEEEAEKEKSEKRYLNKRMEQVKRQKEKNDDSEFVVVNETTDVVKLDEGSASKKATTDSLFTSEQNDSGTNPVMDGIKKNQQSKKIDTMTKDEITKVLRELGIPVRLFGETSDAQRMRRMQEAKESKKATLAGMSEMDEFRLGSGHGIRNPFLGGKKDKQNDLNIKQSAAKGNNGTSNLKRHEDDRDLSKSKRSKPRHSKEDEDSDDPHKRIHHFFKARLRQWDDDLALRPDSIKRTAAGKNETKTLKQCKDYIRPLFKLLKSRRLEENIMDQLLKIVDNCKLGEFVIAHDAYMDVAIGRAAWPIGVTMVGIHARSGRAKIESANVPHVMNSELHRKYLTSVKRLMSYYQKKRTDVAPSKKVMNL